MSESGMQLADYAIPSFRSIAWVSDEARAVWEPRFRKLNDATVEAALIGLAERVWPSLRFRLVGAWYFTIVARAKDYDVALHATALGDPAVKGPVFHEVGAWLRRDRAEPEAAGIPPCCRPRRDMALEGERKELLWEAALATPGCLREDQTLTVEGSPLNVMLWRQLLNTVGSPHLCHFGCEANLKIQSELLELMRARGFGEEADWLSQVGSWPAEWSANHGICELRAPIVKLAHDTDATSLPYRVRVTGAGYPEEGAAGMNFPYRRAPLLRITDSRSFQEGLRCGTR